MPAPRGVFALLVSLLLAAAAIVAVLPPGLAAAGEAWPPSGGIVLAEVMTGGASASDEYVEIANAGSADADLGGCELVYVTASGSTVTRKASFATPQVLAPGQHLLIANAAGIYGPLADATYAGGLAADGGAVALRRPDGTVIDAVGWGAATNSYLEGAVAPAPPAKSSLERLPGGPGGNIVDTNDNLTDWFVQSNPVPQSLASAPVPGSSATASATVAVAPTAVASAPSAPADSAPSTGGPAAGASPTPEPATPPASATPSPKPPATPSSSASASAPASPDLETIAAARAQPAGARVHVAGLVTVEPGLVGVEGLFAIGDASGGIFVRAPASSEGLAVGREVEIEGALAAPYGQLEIRDVVSLIVGTGGEEPSGAVVDLADVGEMREGSLVTIRGTVASVQTDAGRLTITIGDGASTVRVLADPLTGLSKSDVARGDAVLATGIVGQYASATGRLDGYRLWLRRQADLIVGVPSQTETPEPRPTPTARPVYRDLSTALGTRGASVDVEAVVTATAGLLDLGSPTIVVDDGTAAAAVILPDATEVPGVGMQVRVTGKVGRWQGGPTILATGVVAQGELAAVAARRAVGPLDASLEWQLVRVCGRIDRYVRAGARWRLDMTVGGHGVTVLGEPAAAISVTKSAVGRLAVVVGIVRRSTSDSSAFQLLPRMPLDFRLGPAPGALGTGSAAGSAGVSGTGSGGGDPAAGLDPRTVDIGSLAERVGQTVTVAGLVTDASSAMGSSGVTVTVDDGTGAVRVAGQSAADALAMLEPGDAVEVTGLVAEDDQGQIIEADPASLIDLPGDRQETPATAAGAVGRLPGAATPGSEASRAATATIRLTTPQAPLLDWVTILAVLGVALVFVAAALALAGHGRLPGPARALAQLPPSARLARLASRRPRPGRGEGP